MFSTVLVANRGEIACRIIRSIHALGFRAVAVYSDADAEAPHVALADDALRIGPAPVGESYLDPVRLLDAARRAGAQAIHPGYGFLSENASFAQAVIDSGMIFIGPPPGAIDAMGDKARSKVRMRAHGVPVIPGYDDEDQRDEALLAAAAHIGFPLLVKASAGGGGRGMRRVYDAASLPEALRSARAEAESSFGSGRLLLEKLLDDARHVEVQVFADQHGRVLHLGERDCSVQRRHQKVVEEAPSPAVSPALRAQMGEAACAAARAVGYVGAGTVEFLLDADGSFYFLEMNTRLQVEHPVTELITGLDLVALQLRVALGEPLPFTQEEVTLRGHAIEVRLYAEDPSQDYLPATGPVRLFLPPSGEGVRVDHGLRDGLEITANYDPMLAKIMAYGPDRETARRRLARALHGTVLLGLVHNRGFLARVIEDPSFARGEATTAFLGRPEAAALRQPPALDPATACLAAAFWIESKGGAHGWRSAHPGAQPLSLDLNGVRWDFLLSPGAPLDPSGRTAHLATKGASFVVTLRPGPGPLRRARLDGHERSVAVLATEDALYLSHHGIDLSVRAFDFRPAPKQPTGGDGAVRAPSAARVRALRAAVGQSVAPGDPILVVEAMKLETTLRSAIAGVVKEIRVNPGDNVAAGDLLALIAPAEEQPAP